MWKKYKLSLVNKLIVLGRNREIYFRRVITTGRAGGLHKPPWGMSQAEPIGSSNSLPTARLSQACP